MRDRYSIFVGLAFLALIAIATINTLGSDEDSGTLGLDRMPIHWPLPEFAVPAAASSLEGDANVDQDDCVSSRIPCPEGDVRPPACRIDDRGAIRVCDLFRRPLVISFWFGEDGDCVAQQDTLDAVYRRYRDRANFLSLNIRDSRDSLRALAKRRGWAMPLGYDRDGAVAALYRVGICPTLAFVYPGGTLQAASVGRLDEDGLTARLEGLLAATAAAEKG